MFVYILWICFAYIVYIYDLESSRCRRLYYRIGLFAENNGIHQNGNAHVKPHSRYSSEFKRHSTECFYLYIDYSISRQANFKPGKSVPKRKRISTHKRQHIEDDSTRDILRVFWRRRGRWRRLVLKRKLSQLK